MFKDKDATFDEFRFAQADLSSRGFVEKDKEDGQLYGKLYPYYDMFNHSSTNYNAKESKEVENNDKEVCATQNIYIGEEILFPYQEAGYEQY